jgi:hypothetical protein
MIEFTTATGADVVLRVGGMVRVKWFGRQGCRAATPEHTEQPILAVDPEGRWIETQTVTAGVRRIALFRAKGDPTTQILDAF